MVVLQLLCYLVAANGEEVGGLQLHISETGLNKGIFMWVGTYCIGDQVSPESSL